MSDIQQSETPVCVYCRNTTNGNQLLVLSDAAGGPIHENECWQAYMKTPEYEARNAVTVAEHEAYVKWEDAGRSIRARATQRRFESDQLQFDIGDWLVAGEDSGYVRTYNFSKAEELSGYKRSCLRKFALIARRIPAGIRYSQLPWASHQAVAYLKDPEQRAEVLKLAAEKNWKVRDVRKHVKTLPKDVLPNTMREHDKELREGHEALARERLDEWSGALSSPGIGDELMAVLPRIRNKEKLVARLKATAALLISYAERIETFQPAQVEETTCQ